MTSAEAALDRLCDPNYEVSAHYLIAENGRLWHLVEESARAWHAGQGAWGDVRDVNSRSIGIELVNTSRHPYPEPQMRCLEKLLSRITGDHRIAPQRVIGHSDLAPHRKDDPGRRFDWRRLARQGFSVWPRACDDPTADFLTSAATFGYVAPDDVPDPRAVILEAFRQRFRPHAHGPETAQDRTMMSSLARDYPVDRPPPLA